MHLQKAITPLPADEPPQEPARREMWEVLVRHEWLSSVGLAAVIFAGSLALDIFLLGKKDGWDHIGSLMVSNAAFGVIAFALLLPLFRHSRQRRESMVQRLKVIDEMNHHIRNALQVIAFNVRPAVRNQAELNEINEAVNRIHWTLREILPRVEPKYKLFDGSAKNK